MAIPELQKIFSRKNTISVDDLNITIISREDLITNKKASGRHRDLADVEFLEGLSEMDV